MRSLGLTMLVLLTIACDIPVKEPTSTAVEVTTMSDTAATAGTSTTETMAAETEKPMTEYADRVAVLNTSKGAITIRFFPEVAPNHVRNFIDLSEQGFYNGVRFHRVVPGFVIQAGDPNTKTENRAGWGTGGSGKNVKAEFNPIHHARGIVSMARSNHPDSASSQFFIVVKDAGFLDNQYTVFGQVTDGMSVVDSIVAEARGSEMPANPVTIERVTVRAATAKEKGPMPK